MQKLNFLIPCVLEKQVASSLCCFLFCRCRQLLKARQNKGNCITRNAGAAASEADGEMGRVSRRTLKVLCRKDSAFDKRGPLLSHITD